MSINPGMLSSRTDNWATPQEVFDMLDAEFHFEVDVCAIRSNAKCARFYTPKEDGLKQEWKGVNWCNPPYGRTMKEWMKKSYESSLNGATVVCLVVATDVNKTWRELVGKDLSRL